MYPGIDGFLGTRASLMLDVVFVSMMVVVPLLLWSISLVKYRQNFRLHKRVQVTLALVLLVAIISAIALTLRRRKDSRSQDPSAQTRVKRAERVKLVSMPAEKE